MPALRFQGKSQVENRAFKVNQINAKALVCDLLCAHRFIQIYDDLKEGLFSLLGAYRRNPS